MKFHTIKKNIFHEFHTTFTKNNALFIKIHNITYHWKILYQRKSLWGVARCDCCIISTLFCWYFWMPSGEPQLHPVSGPLTECTSRFLEGVRSVSIISDIYRSWWTLPNVFCLSVFDACYSTYLDDDSDYDNITVE